MEFTTISPAPTVITLDPDSGYVSFYVPADAENSRTRRRFFCKRTDYVGVSPDGLSIQVASAIESIQFNVNGAINITGYLDLGRYSGPETGGAGYTARIESILDVLLNDIFRACCPIDITTIGNVVEVEFYVDLPSPGTEGTLYVVTDSTSDDEGLYYWDGTASTGDYVSLNNDVFFFDTFAAFPAVGRPDKLYVDRDQFSNAASKIYWWDDEASTPSYIPITASFAPIAANTLLGNNTGVSAVPSALTVAQVKTLLAYVFTNLGDTPGNYTSAATKLVAVNGAGTGLIYPLVFVDQTSGEIAIGGSGVSGSTFLQLPIPTTARSQINMKAGADPTVPGNGDLYHSVQNALRIQIASTLVDLAVAHDTQESSVTVGNSASELTLLSGIQDFGANFFTAGKTIHILAMGRIANTGTPTIRMRFYLDAVAHIDTGAITMGTITGTGLWIFQGAFVCRTTGSPGTGIGQAYFDYWAATNSRRTATTPMTPTSAIDTTVALTPNLTAQWGTLSASNTMTCDIFDMYILK